MKSNIIGINKVMEVLSTTDMTARIIKSHLILELILNALLNEAVQTNQKLELKKLSFLLKIDLCYSLIPPMNKDLKPLLLKINRIRNQFAHDHDANFDLKGAKELLNTTSLALREGLKCFTNINTPLEIWHACFYSSFIVLNVTFGELAKYKASMEIYTEEIDKILKSGKPQMKGIKKKYSPEKYQTAKKIKYKVQEIYKKNES